MPSRASVFYGLNAARALSIVAILLAFSSSIVLEVSDIRAVNDAQHESKSKDGSCGYIGGSTVPNQPAGVFWAVLNRLLIITQLTFLLFSEISWPMAFFDHYFPVLGTEFGLGPLGIFQGLIGAAILSHRVDTFSLVSAFFLFSVGCLNMALGLVFRENARSKRSIHAWREDPSALPMHTGDISSPVFRSSLFGAQTAKPSDLEDKVNNLGFGRQGEMQPGMNGLMVSQPTETAARKVPRPATLGSLLSVTEPRAPEPENRPGTPKFRSSPTAI